MPFWIPSGPAPAAGQPIVTSGTPTTPPVQPGTQSAGLFTQFGLNMVSRAVAAAQAAQTTQVAQGGTSIPNPTVPVAAGATATVNQSPMPMMPTAPKSYGLYIAAGAGVLVLSVAAAILLKKPKA